MTTETLAWVLRNPVAEAAIVGATNVHHVTDAVAALELDLSHQRVRQLEQPYSPLLPTCSCS